MKVNKRKICTVLSAVLVLGMAMTSFAACKDDSASTGPDVGNTPAKYNAETRPLTMGISTPDGVFNPFFSTSAYDSSIVGMTQISMLGSDEEGHITYGDDEPVVVKDYKTTTYTSGGKEYTDYEFILKNNIKFSDGEPLTIKDVLFNLYFYLDPVYTGSSTIYSTDIVGLQAYRQQNMNLVDEENFENTFVADAQVRVDRLVDYMKTIDRTYTEIDKPEPDTWEESDKVRFREDYTNVAGKFMEELVTDWNAIDMTSYEDWNFTEKWQVFLLNDGQMSIFLAQDAEGKYIKDDDGNYKLNEETAQEYKKQLDDYLTAHNVTDKTRDALTRDWAVNSVYGGYFSRAIDDNGDYDETAFSADKIDATMESTFAVEFEKIVTSWSTAGEIISDFTAQAKTDHFSNGAHPVKTVSGIDGTATTTKDFSGKALDGVHSVLKITINGVDPKAIWNFAFTVAPLHYYSTHNYKGVDYIDEFSETEGNFGFAFGDINFVNNVIKAADKIGLPVGGGAYMASTVNGGAAKKGGDFFDNNIVYYERNPYFYTLGDVTEADKDKSPIQNAVIKYMRYKVVESDQLVNSVTRGDIDIGEPSATTKNIEQLDKNGVAHKEIDTSGYGYVGINPRFVPNVVVRRAIMKAMNTQLVLDNYYTDGLAEIIYRPMSKVSWAYPKGVGVYVSENGTSYKYDAVGQEIKKMIEADKYELGTDGIYHKSIPGYGDDKLEYQFTIAGSSTDHPAYSMFLEAAKILNRNGFKVKVVTSQTALSDLSNGKLAVWAAAWSSTIDPDMYQVYHKDSKATSVSNWGYPQIKANKTLYAKEWAIIQDLSRKIDEARETTDEAVRKDIYADALDLVMEMAVEMPTYQRKDMVAYNKEVLDRSSMTPEEELSPYNGLISKIWELRYN